MDRHFWSSSWTADSCSISQQIIHASQKLRIPYGTDKSLTPEPMPNHIHQVHAFHFLLAILIPAYERWIGVRFPPEARDSSFHLSTKICSEAHSASFALAVRTSFFGNKVVMAWCWRFRHRLVHFRKTYGVIPPFPRTPS